MSRRSKPARRIPAADPLYNSVDVSKFINRIMRRGKKSLAERIFYSTITRIEERTNEKGLEIFQKALTNATPLLEVKARRIGGSTYQVPLEVKADRGFALSSSWLIVCLVNVVIRNLWQDTQKNRDCVSLCAKKRVSLLKSKLQLCEHRYNFSCCWPFWPLRFSFCGPRWVAKRPL